MFIRQKGAAFWVVGIKEYEDVKLGREFLVTRDDGRWEFELRGSPVSH